MINQPIKIIHIPNEGKPLNGAYTDENAKLIQANAGRQVRVTDYDNYYYRFVERVDYLINKQDCKVVQFI